MASLKVRPLTRILLGRQLRIRFLTSWNINKSTPDTAIKSKLTTVHCLPTPFGPSLHSHSPRFMTINAASDSPSSPPIKTVRAVIKGRVQGVFYRNWTVENATQLGLNGWVRNRRDGSVEALFSGKPDAVQEMEQRCRRGPPDAMVTGLEVTPSDEDPGTGFERRPTV